MDDEKILSTNIFININDNFTISKTTNLQTITIISKSFYECVETYSARTELGTKLLDNFFSKRTVGSTRENSQIALNTFYKNYIVETK